MRLKQAITCVLILPMLILTVPACVSGDSLNPLKDKYADYFMLGNAASLPEMAQGSISFETLAKHFDSVTPTDVLMPNALVNEQGVYNFEEADLFIKMARENNLKVIGNTLVWHENTPEWMNVNVTREEAIENLTNYVKTVVSHFGSSIYSWDVVNEAFYDQVVNPDNWRESLRQTPWYTAIGPDYIEIAFAAAQEANPDILLYYNDYLLHEPAKRKAVYNMVKELKEKGIKIDGIGMQGKKGSSASLKSIADSINYFSELGVVISISGLNPHEIDPLTDEKEIKQAYRYSQLFKIFKENSSFIERVTIWGIHDIPGEGGNGNTTLFNEDFTKKASYDALLDPELFIEENANVVDIKAYKLFAHSEYGVPTISSGKNDTVWERANPIKINNHITDWQGADATAKILWNETMLYLLIEVTDRQLDDSSEDPFKQDSVAVYINNNYQNPSEEDGEVYIVNFNNKQTFDMNAHQEYGFVSYAYKTDNGYIVQMVIPFSTIRPIHNDIIGLDIQINDAEFGDIISIARWNDFSGLTPDVSRWGRLILQKNTEKYLSQQAASVAAESVASSARPVYIRVLLIFIIIILMAALCFLIFLAKKEKKA